MQSVFKIFYQIINLGISIQINKDQINNINGNKKYFVIRHKYFFVFFCLLKVYFFSKIEKNIILNSHGLINIMQNFFDIATTNAIIFKHNISYDISHFVQNSVKKTCKYVYLAHILITSLQNFCLINDANSLMWSRLLGYFEWFLIS